jgi:hypothetical protein
MLNQNDKAINMNTHSFFLVIISAITLTSFSSPELHVCRRAGIKGHVFLVRGNQMPSPDRTATPPKGIKTTLYIYGLTNIKDVERDGVSAFYKNIPGEPVREIETDENGYFKAKLKPGLYSLFVKKGDLFYSSQFDEKNNIHPVEVRSGKMTEVDFKANYDAVY